MIGNPCVYTGIRFRDAATGKVHTGDLFRSFGQWRIMGIPSRDGVPIVLSSAPHVLVDGIRYDPRMPDRFVDTPYGITITHCDAEFRGHITSWYPELAELLPTIGDINEA